MVNSVDEEKEKDDENLRKEKGLGQEGVGKAGKGLSVCGQPGDRELQEFLEERRAAYTVKSDYLN